MGATTLNYALPYPTSSDRVCDAWYYQELLAEAVDTILDGFDVDAARLTTVPVVILDSTSAALVDGPVSTTKITYDTVVADTANLINLAVSADTFQATNGYWNIGTSVGVLGSAAGNQQDVRVLNSFDTNFFIETDMRSNTTGEEARITVAATTQYTTTAAPLTTQGISAAVVIAGNGDTTRPERLWAHWVADL